MVPTWRIIPVSKWLVILIYKPFRPFGRGITLLRGLRITMVINHVSKSWDDPPSIGNWKMRDEFQSSSTAIMVLKGIQVTDRTSRLKNPSKTLGYPNNDSYDVSFSYGYVFQKKLVLSLKKVSHFDGYVSKNVSKKRKFPKLSQTYPYFQPLSEISSASKMLLI